MDDGSGGGKKIFTIIVGGTLWKYLPNPCQEENFL
jgi:hypothetical protein